ncbi:hypothetical protein OC846_004782 [Tilletia horrida]|uniref:Brl1/Brr6 domain-containing protein n=1 Tax=Tilletia horrida TaxID=155126 RepID=A0AAN6JQI0_9BASI|nr:hypothetical protein OC846_004782 [Tilletia horrida]KAK0558789.1 hypothetical protein OC861_006828 [Tilletia horrida]
MSDVVNYAGQRRGARSDNRRSDHDDVQAGRASRRGATVLSAPVILDLAMRCGLVMLFGLVIKALVDDQRNEWDYAVAKSQEHKVQCEAAFISNRCDSPVELSFEGCKNFQWCITAPDPPVASFPFFLRAIRSGTIAATLLMSVFVFFMFPVFCLP